MRGEFEVVAYARRTRRGRNRRGLVAVGLLVALVGGVALAALAGARRTASTFAAYEQDNRLSHLAVNSIFFDPDRLEALAALPGVDSTATHVGLNGYPVIDGEVVRDFRYTGTFGSLDGRYFTQDRLTVVEGRLPPTDALDEIVLTPTLLEFARARVGSAVTYAFESNPVFDTKPVEIARKTYRVVGVARVPPVIVDENDIIEGAILTPAATAAVADSAYYAWTGIRLAAGERGIEAYTEALLTTATTNEYTPFVQSYRETRAQVQRSVRPQAVALALFGVAAALAALALGAQGSARLIGGWAAEIEPLRGAGLTRRQLLAAVAADGLTAALIGAVGAAVVAAALSPLAPVGAVRTIAPHTGFAVDAVVLGFGALVFAAVLCATTAVVAVRVAGGIQAHGPGRRSAIAQLAGSIPLPLSTALGARFAVEPARGREGVPARTTLGAGAAAMISVVAAVVFGAGLAGVVNEPARYGWTWDRMIIEQAGYGAIDTARAEAAVANEPGIAAWAMLAFDQMDIDGLSVPVVGLDRRVGSIAQSVVSGRSIGAGDEIALGTNTLGQLGKQVGDTVAVSQAGITKNLEIVGTVVLPSVGIGAADHTSLGRGALLPFATMAAILSPGAVCLRDDEGLCPSAVVFDLEPGADGDAIVARIAAQDLGHSPGGTYEQPVTRAADIRNYDQMRSLPVALAAVLAAAAVAGLAITLLGSVRSRRRDLAILKSLGFTGGQLRSALTAQGVTTAALGLAAGVPLGVAVGRLAWTRFAGTIGVVPHAVVPLLVLVAVAGGALVINGCVAQLPGAIAARIGAARVLRSE